MTALLCPGPPSAAIARAAPLPAPRRRPRCPGDGGRRLRRARAAACHRGGAPEASGQAGGPPALPGPGRIPLAPGLVLDDPLRELRRDGLRLALTPTEYALLRHLVHNRGRIVSDDELAASAWGAEAAVSPQMLYAHISALRGKLGARMRIVRRYAQGYHLEARPEGAARRRPRP